MGRMRSRGVVAMGAGIALVLVASPASATPYVKSVEYVEVLIGGTQTTRVVNLTKNQGVANCVPFASAMMNSTANTFDRELTDVFLTAGSPPTVTVQRTSTGGTVTVGVYVVEFDATYVSVRQGTFGIANGSAGPTSVGTIPVDLARAALVSYHRNSPGATGYDDVTVEGRLSAPNQLQFERYGTTSALTGHWYVFEALNVAGSYAFAVRTATFGFGTPLTTGTAALTPVVPSSETFVVGSYRAAETLDQPNRGSIRLYLSGCSGLPSLCSSVSAQSYVAPNDGPTSVTAFVITFNGGIRVQRGAHSYFSGSAFTTAPLSPAVDMLRTMVWNAVGSGPGAMMANQAASSLMPQAHQHVKLSSTTTVQGNRGLTGQAAVGTWETIEWDVPTVADLSIGKSDGRTSAVPGTIAIYTITVTNNGPGTVGSLFVNDPVPAAIAGANFNPSVGTYNSATGYWTGLSLAPTQSATLSLLGTISPSATGLLTNTATVAPPPGGVDPNSANDGAMDQDTLTPQADLQVSKIGPTTSVLPGATIVYALTARNNGPSDASGVVLVDNLPPDVAFLSSTPPGPTCTYDGGFHRVTCTLGALPAGGSSPVSISVRARVPGTLVNTATVAGAEPDLVPTNNTAVTPVDVDEGPCRGAAGTWWNSSWGGRRKISFNNYGQAQDLYDFPVLIKLDAARIAYGRTQNAGQDLRFVDADDQTVLPHEIERWNEAGTSYAWVRVPRIDASSTGDFIWMYYDNPIAPDGQSPAAVWDPSYVMVQHLNETAGPHTDSTSFANHSVVIDVAAQGSAPGQIDGADLFVASSTHNVDVNDSPSLRMSASDSFTVEAWIKTPAAPGYAFIVNKKENPGSTYQLALGSGNATFLLYDGATSAVAMGASPVADDQWHYLVGRWNEGAGRNDVFVDGLPVGFATGSLGAMGELATPLVIGEEGDTGRGFNFDGRIDEVRVQKTARSDEWIRAQFLSMSDRFARFTAEPGACHLRSIGTRPHYGTTEPEGTGTRVSAATGSRTVVGTGTAWRAVNRGRGDRITIEGTSYTIAAVTTDAALTLTDAFLGGTGAGKSYSIARKFATLQDWESCIDGIGPSALAPCEGVLSDSLVADDRGEVGIAYNDAGHPGYPFAGGLLIDGRADNQNTDAAHTIALTADDRNRHYGLPGGGVLVENAGGTSAAVGIRDNYVSLEWLEIRGGGGGDPGLLFDGMTADDNRLVVRNTLVHDVPGGDGINIRDNGSVVDAVNNILYRNFRHGIAITAPALGAASRIRLLNNTLYDNMLGGVWAAPPGPYPTLLLHNNLSVGNGPDGDYNVPGGPGGASSYNLGEDGSEVGASPLGGSVNSTVAGVLFASAPAGDLHILGASPAHDAGFDLGGLFAKDVDDGDRVSPWDIGADEFPAGAPVADLAIAKSDGQTSAVPGTSIVYTITVTNNGPDPVTSLTVTDPLPPEILGPVFYAPSTGGYDGASGLWTGLSLGPSQSVFLTLTATIDPAATGTLVNTATVAPTSGIVDPVSANNWTSDADTALLPEADLSLTKTDGPDPVAVGGALVYTLTVTNQGPSDATGVVLTDPLPLGVDFVSSVPGVPTCDYSPGPRTVSCNLGGLPASGSAIVTITVTPRSAGTITNTASVMRSEPDPDASDDVASADTTVAVPGNAVRIFTVTSTSQRNVLEWLNPTLDYLSTEIRWRTDRFPADETDGTFLYNGGTPGAKDSVTHAPLTNGDTYYYAAFVHLGAGGVSAGRFTSGRPFDISGATKWAYSTGATAMAPPGNGVGAIHAVSNDSALHSMVKGDGASAGTWPPLWTPLVMNGPSQGRPSTLPVAVGTASRVVFLGAQDGYVYTIDADRGNVVWPSALLAPMVLAAPSGVFTAFGGSRDYILVGGRDSSSDNKFYALNLADGSTAAGWPFTGGGAGRIGVINKQAAVDYVNRRVYFTSYAFGPPPDDNTVWCVNFDTGALVWARAFGNMATSPSVRGDRLYVGTVNGEVLALDTMSNGDQKWMIGSLAGAVNEFVMLDRLSQDLYFSAGDTLYSFRDADTIAAFRWLRSTIPSPSAPVVASGDVYGYVGSGDGQLYRFNSADGSDAPGAPATFPLPLGDGQAAVGSVTIDLRDGFLYVGTEAGVVYAVRLP